MVVLPNLIKQHESEAEEGALEQSAGRLWIAKVGKIPTVSQIAVVSLSNWPFLSRHSVFIITLPRSRPFVATRQREERGFIPSTLTANPETAPPYSYETGGVSDHPPEKSIRAGDAAMTHRSFGDVLCYAIL